MNWREQKLQFWQILHKMEQIKKDGVRYWKKHLHLGTAKSTHFYGGSLFSDYDGNIHIRGRGNFESDEVKEIVHLRK